MNPHAPTALPVAVRVYSTFEPRRTKRQKSAAQEDRPRRPWARPAEWLVFDCETRTDETQRLTFGSYRYLEHGEQLEEGLFVADDLTRNERRTINQYAARHSLPVLTVGAFREKLYWLAYKARVLVIGFNLPFDFSRIADDVSEARQDYYGGFAFWMASRTTTGKRRPNNFRPKVRVKHLDSMRARIGLAGKFRTDEEDKIPDDSIDGQPVEGYSFPGYFLDLRTLSFALSDSRYSLETACKAFRVKHRKKKAARHGVVTPKYITYNRRDVLATTELAAKLLEELGRHPVELRATRAYSPASVGKAYLSQMGIPPVLKRQPDFPREYLGYAQTAFFGGRTSAHIRRVPVPVVYTDFLSMYPTVNALMGLWPILTAKTIKTREHCAPSVRRFLRRIAADPDSLFTSSTWQDLNAFVRVVPRGDVLPCRAVYSEASHDWQVGVNHVYAGGEDTERGMWYALPDVVASVVLAGKIPEIVDAFRIVGVGRLQTMRSVLFRGVVPVNPETEDFFRTVVERRQQYKKEAKQKTQAGREADRIQAGLKVIANSTAYGINAQFDRQDTEFETRVECRGIDAEGFQDWVTHPEQPGEYCFPPLASLNTSGARLMLALLEREVERRGGTYAMEDTDSMAIVATKEGGPVACPGGPHRLDDGREAVRALSWKDVENIRDRFDSLNPYDRAVVSGSVLKIVEGENFTKSGRQRQIYCLAISAKRYALFTRDANGRPHLLRGKKKADNRWSEHGLGHLMNPLDPEDEKRDWIGQVWEGLVRKALNLPATRLPFAQTPAAGRVTVSSPAVLRAFRDFNEKRSYSARIKPFNFLLACHVAPFGHPPRTNPQRFHLIAPYEKNSRRWLKATWLDQYSGRRYRVQTGRSETALPNTAHVQSYADVLEAYEFHPEAKCATSDGTTSGKQTTGLHFRRHIILDSVTYIGKESNELEEVESGAVSPDEAYVVFQDKRRDYWNTKVRPAMNNKRASIEKLRASTGLSRHTIIDARKGRRRPHRRHQQRIITSLKRWGLL